MNIDAQRARMLANGSSIGEAMGNSTKDSINNLFKDSPFYKVIQIDGVNTEARIVSKNVNDSGKSSQQKNLTFRPDTKPNIGSLVDYNSEKWMILDFNNNDIFPVAMMQQCNHILEWQRESIIHSYPTVTFSRSSFKDDVKSDRVMTLANGQYQLYIKSDENTLKLNIDDRFFIGRDVYEIAYIDEVSLKGILIFTLNKDTLKSTDNDELGIADYVEPTDPENPPEDDGGDWW